MQIATLIRPTIDSISAKHGGDGSEAKSLEVNMVKWQISASDVENNESFGKMLDLSLSSAQREWLALPGKLSPWMSTDGNEWGEGHWSTWSTPGRKAAMAACAGGVVKMLQLRAWKASILFNLYVT